MADNKESETKVNFAEYVRQGRIDKLMGIEEAVDLKKGTYDPSPEVHDERRKELNHYTSTLLYDMIKDAEEKLNDIALNESAKRSASLRKDGILTKRDSARER